MAAAGFKRFIRAELGLGELRSARRLKGGGSHDWLPYNGECPTHFCKKKLPTSIHSMPEE